MATEAEVNAYLTAAEALVVQVRNDRDGVLSDYERVTSLRSMATAIEGSAGPLRVTTTQGAEASIPGAAAKGQIATLLRNRADAILAGIAIPTLP